MGADGPRLRSFQWRHRCLRTPHTPTERHSVRARSAAAGGGELFACRVSVLPIFMADILGRSLGVRNARLLPLLWILRSLAEKLIPHWTQPWHSQKTRPPGRPTQTTGRPGSSGVGSAGSISGVSNQCWRRKRRLSKTKSGNGSQPHLRPSQLRDQPGSTRESGAFCS